MNQLCFYPLALTASTLLAALAPASRPSLALWMLGALPVFFLYYARKHCKHLSVLLLLHGLVLACFYIIPAANGVNRGIPQHLLLFLPESSGNYCVAVVY